MIFIIWNNILGPSPCGRKYETNAFQFKSSTGMNYVLRGVVCVLFITIFN